MSVLSDSSQTVLEHHNLDIICIFGCKVDVPGSLHRYAYVLALCLQRNIRINIHSDSSQEHHNFDILDAK